MEERYGSYDSGMNVFRRDTEFFRQRQTFSYQEQSSSNCLNLSFLAGILIETSERNQLKITFQTNIKMVMVSMLNCTESCLKKFSSFLGLVCNHFTMNFHSIFGQKFLILNFRKNNDFKTICLEQANTLIHRISSNWTTKSIFIKLNQACFQRILGPKWPINSSKRSFFYH